MTEKEELLQLRQRVTELESMLKLRDKVDRMRTAQLEKLERSGVLVLDRKSEVYYSSETLEGVAATMLNTRVNNLEMPDVEDLYSEFDKYDKEQASNKMTSKEWKNKTKLERYKAFVKSERFLPSGIYRLNNLVNMIITANCTLDMIRCVRQAGGDASHWESYVLDPEKVTSADNKRDVKIEVNDHIIVIQIDESMYETSGAGIQIYMED